jgi:hypothetical protein
MLACRNCENDRIKRIRPYRASTPGLLKDKAGCVAYRVKTPTRGGRRTVCLQVYAIVVEEKGQKMQHRQLDVRSVCTTPWEIPSSSLPRFVWRRHFEGLGKEGKFVSGATWTGAKMLAVPHFRYVTRELRESVGGLSTQDRLSFVVNLSGL